MWIVKVIRYIIFLQIYYCYHELEKKQGFRGTFTYSFDLENELRAALFPSYNMFARPDATVSVSVRLNLITLNDLSLKDQTMKITGFFEISWSDSRLSWSTNTTYMSIDAIFSNEDYIWRPAVIVQNSVESISVISDEEIPIRIGKDGILNWSPTGIYTTSCDVDVTYYPFDSQTCEVHISSWGYTSSEISLSFASEPVKFDYYTSSGEWDYVEYTLSSASTSRNGMTYSQLLFDLKFRRKPLFLFSNSVLPMTLLSVLSCMVFKLQPESGEKMGFALTVLLSYAVYLTIVAADIPTTSIHVSILSVYLICNLCLGIVSVIVTIFVLDCHHRDPDDEIPKWLRKLTLNFMAPLCCINGKRMGCNGKESKVVSIDCEKDGKEMETALKKKLQYEIKNGTPDNSTEKEQTWTTKKDELSWDKITKILDKFFLRLYLVIVAIVTIVFYTCMLIGYLIQ